MDTDKPNADDFIETKIVEEDKIASSQFILNTLADFLTSAIHEAQSARKETRELAIFKRD